MQAEYELNLEDFIQGAYPAATHAARNSSLGSSC